MHDATCRGGGTHAMRDRSRRRGLEQFCLAKNSTQFRPPPRPSPNSRLTFEARSSSNAAWLDTAWLAGRRVARAAGGAGLSARLGEAAGLAADATGRHARAPRPAWAVVPRRAMGAEGGGWGGAERRWGEGARVATAFFRGCGKKTQNWSFCFHLPGLDSCSLFRPAGGRDCRSRRPGLAPPSASVLLITACVCAPAPPPRASSCANRHPCHMADPPSLLLPARPPGRPARRF